MEILRDLRLILHPSSLIPRVAAAIAAMLLCLVANAQPYPSRPVRIVVPAAPGGAIDVVGRIVAQKLTDSYVQNFIIDNRGGANYIIGTELVARSPADGYTLLLTGGAHTINPAVYRKLPYDTLRDFTPITHIANSGGLVIVVHPSFPAQSLKQLISMARESPGKINYGSAGFGNLTHLAGELFNVMAGVKLTHVPYKSAGPAINDLLGGQIPLMFGPSPVVTSMVQGGRLRALAFTGLKRSSQLPAVPTADEAGIKGYEATGWYGLYGPRGLSKLIADSLSAALRKIVQMPDTHERFVALSLEAIGSTPDEFAKFLKQDLEKYARIAKLAKIEPQ
ncbi:MAG TPA: tripartite tricarboxylate transporter substrate binding protein [Burkholderiales bacterium]|nr:tripartite tricarboxylate transporter substrate binding protein [Burkholderiales bacterium]